MVGIRLVVHDEGDESTFQSDRLVGSKTGLVNELRFKNPQRGREHTVLATVETASMTRTLPQPLEQDTDFASAGNGRTVDRTRLSTLGEFAERYCAHWLPSDDDEAVVTGTYSDVERAGNPIPFEYLRRYRPEQLRDLDRSAFAEGTTTRWVAGRDLRSGRTVHVPEELVYIRSEKRHFYSSSNGSACGDTLGDAVVGGIHEAVERDAVMRAWFLGETPTRLALDSYPEVAAYRDAIADARSTVTVVEFDAPGDFHAVGATYVNDRDAMPKFLFCADAALCLRSAVEGALSELAQALDIVTSALAFRDAEDLARIEHRITEEKPALELGDNVMYYLYPEHFEDVAPLLDGATETATAEPRSFETGRAELRECLDAFGDREVTPVAFDVTTRDVRELGWSVASVVVPELVPFCRPGIPPARHPVLADHELRDACHPLG